MKARALTFLAPREVGIEELEVPETQGGRVLVETECSGISGGTEMLAYRGEIGGEVVLDETLDALAGTFSYPFPYGYSCVGRVRSDGGPGRAGELVFAFHPHQDLFAADPSDLVALPQVSARIATLFPLVETALQVSLETRARRGELVVVLGLGPVGILAALLVAGMGAEVVCGEPRPWRREVAASLGLTAVSPEELPERARRGGEGTGANCVIEASGSPAALGPALGLLAHEGTALVVSWYGAKPVTLPLGADFHRRRLTIRSLQVSSIPSELAGEWTIPRRREEAAGLLTRLPLQPLATHTYPFERAGDAFAALDRGDEGLLHAALRY